MKVIFALVVLLVIAMTKGDLYDEQKRGTTLLQSSGSAAQMYGDFITFMPMAMNSPTTLGRAYLDAQQAYVPLCTNDWSRQASFVLSDAQLSAAEERNDDDVLFCPNHNRSNGDGNSYGAFAPWSERAQQLYGSGRCMQVSTAYSGLTLDFSNSDVQRYRFALPLGSAGNHGDAAALLALSVQLSHGEVDVRAGFDADVVFGRRNQSGGAGDDVFVANRYGSDDVVLCGKSSSDQLTVFVELSAPPRGSERWDVRFDNATVFLKSLSRVDYAPMALFYRHVDWRVECHRGAETAAGSDATEWPIDDDNIGVVYEPREATFEGRLLVRLPSLAGFAQAQAVPAIDEPLLYFFANWSMAAGVSGRHMLYESPQMPRLWAPGYTARTLDLNHRPTQPNVFNFMLLGCASHFPCPFKLPSYVNEVGNVLTTTPLCRTRLRSLFVEGAMRAGAPVALLRHTSETLSADAIESASSSSSVAALGDVVLPFRSDAGQMCGYREWRAWKDRAAAIQKRASQMTIASFEALRSPINAHNNAHLIDTTRQCSAQLIEYYSLRRSSALMLASRVYFSCSLLTVRFYAVGQLDDLKRLDDGDDSSDDWANVEPIVIDDTRGCSLMPGALDASNGSWADDPCCSPSLVVEQCCAPRTVVIDRFAYPSRPLIDDRCGVERAACIDFSLSTYSWLISASGFVSQCDASPYNVFYSTFFHYSRWPELTRAGTLGARCASSSDCSAGNLCDRRRLRCVATDADARQPLPATVEQAGVAVWTRAKLWLTSAKNYDYILRVHGIAQHNASLDDPVDELERRSSGDIAGGACIGADGGSARLRRACSDEPACNWRRIRQLDDATLIVDDEQECMHPAHAPADFGCMRCAPEFDGVQCEDLSRSAGCFASKSTLSEWAILLACGADSPGSATRWLASYREPPELAPRAWLDVLAAEGTPLSYDADCLFAQRTAPEQCAELGAELAEWRDGVLDTRDRCEAAQASETRGRCSALCEGGAECATREQCEAAGTCSVAQSLVANALPSLSPTHRCVLPLSYERDLVAAESTLADEQLRNVSLPCTVTQMSSLLGCVVLEVIDERACASIEGARWLDGRASSAQECESMGVGCVQSLALPLGLGGVTWARPEAMGAEQCDMCGGTLGPIGSWTPGQWIDDVDDGIDAPAPLEWRERQFATGLRQWRDDSNMSPNAFERSACIMQAAQLSIETQRLLECSASQWLDVTEAAACQCTLDEQIDYDDGTPTAASNDSDAGVLPAVLSERRDCYSADGDYGLVKASVNAPMSPLASLVLCDYSESKTPREGSFVFETPRDMTYEVMCTTATVSILRYEFERTKTPPSISGPLYRHRITDNEYAVVVSRQNQIVGQILSVGVAVVLDFPITAGRYTLCIATPPSYGFLPVDLDALDTYAFGRLVSPGVVRVERSVVDVEHRRNWLSDGSDYLCGATDLQHWVAFPVLVSGALVADDDDADYWQTLTGAQRGVIGGAIAFNSITLLGVLVVLALHCVPVPHFALTMPKLVLLLLLASLLLWLVYLTLIPGGAISAGSDAEMVLSELPTLLFFSVFSVLLAQWVGLLVRAKASHVTRSANFRPIIMTALVAANVLVYGGFIAFIVVFSSIADAEQSEHDEFSCASTEPDYSAAALISYVYRGFLFLFALVMTIMLFATGFRLHRHLVANVGNRTQRRRLWQFYALFAVSSVALILQTVTEIVFSVSESLDIVSAVVISYFSVYVPAAFFVGLLWPDVSKRERERARVLHESSTSRGDSYNRMDDRAAAASSSPSPSTKKRPARSFLPSLFALATTRRSDSLEEALLDNDQLEHIDNASDGERSGGDEHDAGEGIERATTTSRSTVARDFDAGEDDSGFFSSIRTRLVGDSAQQSSDDDDQQHYYFEYED
jgi:hypothetical protein